MLKERDINFRKQLYKFKDEKITDILLCVLFLIYFITEFIIIISS